MTRPLDRPHVLLTGASGVLGSVIAAELAPLADLTCLTRRRPVPLAGVRSVHGDLSRPDMGLSARETRALADRVDVVVHCAALTSFTADSTVPDQVNRDGTSRVLELTAAAGARLVHVSTAFVDRLEEFDGTDPGGELDGADPGAAGSSAHGAGADRPVRSPEHYLRSKVAAEAAVRSSGVPYALVRPSVLIGDSATGAISGFQGWHRLCAGLITGDLAFLPADGSALVDTVPVDLAARAVSRLALAGGTAGEDSEWWLTAGAAALSIDSTVDACLEVARDRELATGRPRLLPREMVERLVLPAFGQSAPPRLLRQMLEGMELMRLFGSRHLFPRRWPTELGAAGPEAPELASAVRTSLDFLADDLDLGRRAEVA